MKKALFLTVLAASALVSCENTPIDPEVNVGKLPISISPSAMTRVTDSSYEANDEVGLYVVNHDGLKAGSLTVSGNHVDNVRFTFSGNAWTPENEIFWIDNTTKADFYAYHPYVQEISDINALTFTVARDQSELEEYKASDFMWGKASSVAPTASPVAITTNHVMSNLVIYIENGEGFTDEEFAAAEISVKIDNIKYNSTIDLSTGNATATGATGEIIPYKESDHYRALVVPQTVGAGTEFVIITVNGNEYAFKQAITLTGNTRHKMTITIEKDKLSSSAVFNVGPWEEDTTEYSGTITIDNELAGATLIDYVDEYGINQGKGIDIDGTIWAPVNCGYHATDFKYGKYYQWGRKYGQGYKGKEHMNGSTIECQDASFPSISSSSTSLANGQDPANANKCYMPSQTSDWTYESNDNLWNSGSESTPVKTEYDPCPTGWRVPTYKETIALGEYILSNNEYDQPGFYFSGTTPVDEADDLLFLALGGRWTYFGYADDRRNVGYFWTSRAASDGEAYYLLLYSEYVLLDDNIRMYGCSVRCVQE